MKFVRKMKIVVTMDRVIECVYIENQEVRK